MLYKPVTLFLYAGIDMGKVLAAGIFIITVLLVFMIVLYFGVLGDTTNTRTSGRNLFDSDFNYTINYPVRWERLSEKGLEGEYPGSIDIMFEPINTTGTIFYAKYPYESGGLNAYDIMQKFEKDTYQSNQLFTSTSTKEIFQGERDAYDMVYKTGIGDNELRHRKIIIVDRSLVFEMNFVAPYDDYRLFEQDADYMFLSFKMDWENI